MATFKISAPGRIVLAGEHSAMYFAQHLITSSIDRRTTLEFCEVADENIEIDFSDINLQTNIPLENVRSFLSEHVNDRHDDTFLLKYVKSLITFNGMWMTYEQRFSLIIFFTLLYYVANEQTLIITPFRVRVSTNIPIGAGLGSSTSFTVCLAACFLHWKNLQSGYHIDFNDAQFLADVYACAYLWEEFVQNYEFALVDAKVCVYGKILQSQLINHVQIADRNHIHIVDLNPQINLARMRILLIDSDIRQEKRIQAEKMALLKFVSPPAFYTILKELDTLASRIFIYLNLLNDTLQNGFNLFEQQQYYNNLQHCIARTQQLLNENNLTNEAFNNIWATAQNMGFAAKITGFGPGYAYILLPPNFINDQIREIETQLRSQNFNVINTSINCDGVRLEN